MPSAKIPPLIFLGGGQMAEAIFCRLIDSKELIPQEITVSDINIKRLDYLYKAYGIKTSRTNKAALDSENPVVLAVKPQQVSALLNEVSDKIGRRLVISVAAGITTRYIEKQLPRARVVRVMPNVAALVGTSIAAVSKGAKAKAVDVDITKKVFSRVGQVIEVKESLQNAVTAISGSGPAYFFYLIELLADAGSSVGLSKKHSRQLAIQTMIGSSELLKTEKSPEDLRKMVTSPGGTTEAAIKSFNENHLSAIVETAVQKASQRAKELSKDN